MRWIVVMCLALFAYGHDLGCEISKEVSVVVKFGFGNDEEDFSYKSYEIYAPGETVPFAVGRTDKLSRLYFIPDRPGKWTVKVIGEDGHGKTIRLAVTPDMTVSRESTGGFEKFEKIMIGIGIILGLFAIFQFLFYKRRYS